MARNNDQQGHGAQRGRGNGRGFPRGGRSNGGRGDDQGGGTGGGRGRGQGQGRGQGRGQSQGQGQPHSSSGNDYASRGRGGGRGYARGPGAGGNGFARGQGAGRFAVPATRAAQGSHSYGNITNMSCGRFISTVLASCPTARLAAMITDSEAMWTASWRNAASLDATTLQLLLTALARLPVSANVPAPRLSDVVAAVAAFLRHASDPAYASSMDLEAKEAKLYAVEVVEKVFQRLVKFVWHEAKGDVEVALADLLADADRLLETRDETHRKARQRVSLLFDELEKPWTIRTTVAQATTPAQAQVGGNATAGSGAKLASSPWTRPTIAWLSDWNNFQPLKLPKMKVPDGDGDGVYDTPDQYFDTTIELWTGMTFVDGHNSLLPHCQCEVNGKLCDQPLWPIHTRGFSEYRCRSRGCAHLVEYVCANRMHHLGLCKSCAHSRQQKLRGPPSDHASTHIYDANLRLLRYDGKVFLTNVVSRRPPKMAIHWKTTRRLASPNLVGIVVLAGRGASLKLSDEIYWAKVALNGPPRDEFREREQGRVTLELLEYTVDETGNPLLAREIENGASIAIIDCQTFVPEFIPVLKALERQRQMPMPFQSGVLVNLQRRRYNSQADTAASTTTTITELNGEEKKERATSGQNDDEEESDEDTPTSITIGGENLTSSRMRFVISMLVEKSLLDPIVQIRRDEHAANLLRGGLYTLVTQATLDHGQLESFLVALHHPVHCTQGPPGTGKSYLGVVIVRALLLIRKLWMRVAPSVGEPPILVLSYKNHAIDEFLLDLVKAEVSIRTYNSYKPPMVRLGGGCTEPTLFRYQESNAVAMEPKVKALSDDLEDLHKLATTVRDYRNCFGGIFEAQVLCMDGEQQPLAGDAESKRDSMKIRSQAATELAKVTAAIIAVSKLEEEQKKETEETKPETEEASEAVAPTAEEKEATMVKAATENIKKTAILTYKDIPTLYDGIRHYDASMDPAEILFKWMSGVVPLPACAYEFDDCPTLVEDYEENAFCKQHRCHFRHEEETAGCHAPVELRRPFCISHLCAADNCKAPVCREGEAFCTKHACFVCLRDGDGKFPVRFAEDAPPRNTCLEHPLCWAAPRGEQCNNEVSSPDSSYCAEHAFLVCRGVSRSGKPCTNTAISRSIPFCYSHSSQSAQEPAAKTSGQTVSASQGVAPGVCAAKTKKGKDCRGKALPGAMFCGDHARKGAQFGIQPTTRAAPVESEFPAIEIMAVAPSLALESGQTDTKQEESKQQADEEVSTVAQRTKTPQPLGDDEEEKQEWDGSDAFSVCSDSSFVSCGDLAIDTAQAAAGEEDYDEPEHIQHLRDVDEVNSGVEDDEELTIADDDDDEQDAQHGDHYSDAMQEYEIMDVCDWHWDMPLAVRWQSIRALLRRWDPMMHTMLHAIRSTFERTKRELHEERKRARTGMYEGRAVIGGTITGCVTRLEAIRATKPFAVLVEEASEVLEPLLFACLGSTTCKLEMIGDHLQLQPSVMSKFDFERINKINISMFERLIRAPPEYEVPSSVLSIQRRMRKDIADLTREFYAEITVIEDHEVCGTKTIQPAKTTATVVSRPSRFTPLYANLLRGGPQTPVTVVATDKVSLSITRGREVLGVAPHLFYWTHKGREEKAHVGLSRINPHEADMACHLAKYLVDCGVPSKSIAILTPYKGQLMLMRKLLLSPKFKMGIMSPGGKNMPSKLEPSCTISTVDRFQGDEADVVIVSLVIDGKSKTPFVKLQNRMIVLLSRARIGMYILNNMEYFNNHASKASAPAHWQATLDKLRLPAPSDNPPSVDKVWPVYDQARIGDALPLCCPQHRESVRLAQAPTDLCLTFCQVICREPLSCTHECGMRCHWITPKQHTPTCKKQVDSPCVRHPGNLLCSKVCQSTLRVTIQDALAAYQCDKLVELQLPCTHVQQVTCARETNVLKTSIWPACTEKAITPFVYPDCKHERKCSCVEYYAFQANGGRAAPKCTQNVDYLPSCGHEVKLKCYLRASHMDGHVQYVCKETVKILLPRCGHDAIVACPVATSLQSWTGSTPSTFGIVEEGVSYGATDHPCNKMVTFRRVCGHASSVKCGAAFSMAMTNPSCAEKVDHANPECGHTHHTTCSEATRLQQRVDQVVGLRPLPDPVAVVDEADRASCFRNFGLNIPCPAKVKLQRTCGHVQELACRQARSTSQPCRASVDAKRPDCGHDCTISCALTETLGKWQPWTNVGQGSTISRVLTNVLGTWQPWANAGADAAAVQELLTSGVLSTTLQAPKMPIPQPLQPYMKVCTQSLLLKRDATCGHEIRLPCDQAMKIARGEQVAPPCRLQTTKTLACGHTVDVACHVDSATIKCKKIVTKSLACGHTVEVACDVDVAKVECKEDVAKPCWNADVCHQTVQTKCFSSMENGHLLQCESRVVWTCASGRHVFHLAVCSKGVPAACPSCSHEALEEAIESVREICMAEPSTAVPWPPVGVPQEAMDIPAFSAKTLLSDDDKRVFYSRQLMLLERFRGWTEQEEDVWTRALYQPLLVPVFATIDSTKRNVMTPVTKFEVRDFASTATWNSVQAFPLTAANVVHMIPTKGGSSSGGGGGGGKKKRGKASAPPPPPVQRVVFGVIFTLGLNADALSNAPTAINYGRQIGQWIGQQQEEFGYDCAFFAKKRHGLLSGAGVLRVWDPYAMFPIGEASVRESDRKIITEQTQTTFMDSWQPPSSRFISFSVPRALPNSIAHDGDGTADSGRLALVSHLSADQQASCKQLFDALPFPWTAGIRLVFPWTGKQLVVESNCSLPESVEHQLHEKLKFLQGNTPKKSKGKGGNGPFAGINLLKNVTARQPFDEADLFTALELLEVRKDSTVDALGKLESYVKHKRQTNGFCHPLVLVALARVVTRDPSSATHVKPSECLSLFQSLYPEATPRYLTVVEQKALSPTPIHSSSATAGANPASGRTSPDENDIAARWQALKDDQNCSSDAMDELLKMVGLRKVKRFAINMFKSALAFQQMTPSQRKKNLPAMNYCFVGNPGTGKTTVAKLFARILHDSKMRRNNTAAMCSAQELKDKGVQEFRDKTIKNAMGGVVFVDEAYELDPGADPKGKPIVAEILFAAEEHRHDLSVILAGYEDDIQQKLYTHNDGMRSRFTEVMFDDFDEADLRVIWDRLLEEREWKCDDKISTVACRRLARGAGRKGFGNARDVRQLVDDAAAEAMAREDFAGVMELRAVDVIGEQPSKNPKLDLLLEELNGKIGWKRIKQRVRELIDVCDANYERELHGREVLSVVMNRLFLGNPGTGKTTCASLYGKLLKLLGFLSNGEVVKKTASDFVGQHVGQSQTKTVDILKLAKGKVLIIDEAYNLDDSWYGKQVLDTLVEKVQGSDTDDIAVILIGYEHQMTEMLRTQNPGLARRFPIEFAFFFDDYDENELLEIFWAACKKKSVYCPQEVAEEVDKVLSMQRRQANFGNAGAVEMLLKNAMANASKRPIPPGEMMMRLEMEDIENDLLKRSKDEDDEDDTKPKEPQNPLKMLDGLYRMDNIKQELERLRMRVQVAEEEGEERPEIGHFVFRGSPGTGKTTVARVMGKILHHMGLLGTDRVVETSGLNLTGEYVGHTKKKVEVQLGQARGAILFIDEAYELGKGHFGEEAMTTLVAAMTNPMYDGMVIILAGYPADMDTMLDRNAGLKSRFTRFLEFPDWETSDCISFMKTRSAKEKYRLDDDKALEILTTLFDALRSFPGFGNGRDVDKVWKSLLECRAQRVVGNPELERTITWEDAEAASVRVLDGRKPPEKPLLCRPSAAQFGYDEPPIATDTWFTELPPQQQKVLDCHEEEEATPAQESEPDKDENSTGEEETSGKVKRDAGVSDEVWEELERAKEAYEKMVRDLEAQRLRKIKDEEDRKRREEAQRKLDEYKATQAKIRRLCKCPAGFDWNQVSGGWRCSGGSHLVSNAELERNYTH